MREIIRIKNLTYSYGKEQIFSDFCVSIKENNMVIFSGSSGSGKTTLIKLIAGLLPSKNTIVIGHSYINNKKSEPTTRDIGVMLSDLETKFLFDNAYQELCFPLENLNYNKDQIEERIISIAKLFRIQEILDKKINALTTSEKKKLSLVLAVLHEPKILLLDQPFSMLTNKDRLFLISVLKKLQKEQNITIVIATNNLEDSYQADYLYVLEKGNIIIEGNPLSVMQEDKLLNRLGLEIPFMVDLSLKLKFYNLIDSIDVDMDRMVNILWK